MCTYADFIIRRLVVNAQRPGRPDYRVESVTIRRK